MQKKLIAMAVAGLASGAALAQSNVTVYGIVDMAYIRGAADGASSRTFINSGGLSGSRLGFKGVEDLGNGLKAVFNLEWGMEVDQQLGLGQTGTGAAIGTNSASGHPRSAATGGGTAATGTAPRRRSRAPPPTPRRALCPGPQPPGMTSQTDSREKRPFQTPHCPVNAPNLRPHTGWRRTRQSCPSG